MSGLKALKMLYMKITFILNINEHFETGNIVQEKKVTLKILLKIEKYSWKVPILEIIFVTFGGKKLQKLFFSKKNLYQQEKTPIL